MNLIEIIDVEHAPTDAKGLLGRSIDVPKAGSRSEAVAVDILGWALSPTGPPEFVDIREGARLLRRAPIRVPRPDVAARFGDVPGGTVCGFETSIRLTEMIAGAIEVVANLGGEIEMPIGRIRVKGRWRGDDDPTFGSLVSVIIPCYNQAHFVAEAIQSALAQTHSRLEILVVDDGSTDNTAEVVSRYPSVRYLRQENQGLSGARNTGIRRTNGNFLLFLDSDDRLLPSSVADHLEAFAAHPAAVFVSGQHRVVGADGTLLWESPPRRVGEHRYLDLLSDCHIMTPGAVLFRRAAFDAGPFNRSRQACEDYDLYLRITCSYPCYTHERTVVEYRRHGGNWGRNSALMLQSIREIFRAERRLRVRTPEERRAWQTGWRRYRREYGGLLAEAARQSLQDRHWKIAVRDAIPLLRYSPRSAFALLRNWLPPAENR